MATVKISTKTLDGLDLPAKEFKVDVRMPISRLIEMACEMVREHRPGQGPVDLKSLTVVISD